MEAAPDRAEVAHLGFDRAHLRIRWRDGAESLFWPIWLRDNCSCAACRDVHSGQRLFDIASMADGVSIEDAGVDASGQIVLTLAPDRHPVVLEPGWLRRHSGDPSARAARRRALTLWDASSGTLPTQTHAAVAASRSALARWLDDVLDRGVGLLRAVPVESGEVARVAELFGHVRVTNYGRFFDVRSEPTPINLAYTGLGLGVHTDNPYRDPVPGLQLLHCLESTTTGGDSVIVDGFWVAERLRREAPRHFELLTQWEVPFRFEDAATHLTARWPIIQVDGGGALRAVHYNNRSVWAFDLPEDVMAPFYEAYCHFGRLLQDPQSEIRFRLEPGDLFMVNNRRVLHGRDGFSDGWRHLQGCYADVDAVESFVTTSAAETKPTGVDP